MSRWACALVASIVCAVAGGARAESVSSLEARAKAFYELIERGDKARATEIFPTLERDLVETEKRLRDELDDMRSDGTDTDDDTPPAQRPDTRDVQVRGLLVSYHLAWVRYQGAQLVDAARKPTLLREAIDDFARFTEMDDVKEIAAEAEYGQGLAFMDLGDWAKATAHLQAAAKLPKLAGRSKAALAEVKRRAAGGDPDKPDTPAPEPEKPPEVTPESLLGDLKGLLPKAAQGDAAAEKRATELARGLAARGGTWPQQISDTITSTLGQGTDATVRASYGLFLLAQLAIDRNRCADVTPLVPLASAVQDAARARFYPEILFMDGGCKLNAGKAREAATTFGELVKDFPTAPRAREAAYYRLRALDTVRGAEASAAPQYEEALRSYLQRFPTGDAVTEVRYRLGELLRTQGQCPAATVEYGKAGGAYASRAALGSLECRVAELTAKPGATPEERRALVAALQAYVKATPARGEDQGRVAEAALLGALVAAKGATPDHATTAELTDDFESKYPAAKTYFAQALELRLRARVALGRPADAGKDLTAFVKAGPLDADRRKLLAQVARDLAAQAERASDPNAMTAATLARAALAALVANGGTDAERIQLADLTLKSGDAAAARGLYDAVLAANANSAEALRGAARASASAGDARGALGYWKRIVDGTTVGGTTWYEARVEQVRLLSELGEKGQACEVARSSRGRATTTGGDALAARLRQLETTLCQ